jgi:radical SAM family uncharacterized protein/radical SAM-linked protein
MSTQSRDDIIGLVSRPSRYLGSEINTVLKNPSDAGLHIALAFPDLYDIGTSHFGMQILYDVLNRQPDIYAERIFAPADDMAQRLVQTGRPLFSLETGTPLSEFDIIGFSLLYELNYTNILLILDLAGIPFYAASRDKRHPLIIAGGPCTVNPEPVADFFDAMVVGDGETVILEMTKAAMAWKKEGGSDRDELLKAWSHIEGVYIPSFFTVSHDAKDRQILTPRIKGYEKIRRAIVPDLDLAAFPDSPVIPFGNPVHDRLRLEIARGCTRGCRFCQAGMIYRPVRERSLSKVAALARTSIDSTGYEDVSLLSLSTGDYTCLSPLLTHLMKTYADRRVAVSIPSFRAGSLSYDLMDQIQKVRKTGFTIAPEAGSERLRAVINKNISEEEIIETTGSAFKLGYNLIKLYFMIGLPTETDDDLKAIVSLVKSLRKAKPAGRRHFNINASVAAFIPKAHTPFQWALQDRPETAREKIEMLRRELKMPDVRFKWQNPETSRLEGLFARGDRRLSALLVAAYGKGCRFDGWTDAFRYPKWMEALEEAGIDPEALAEKTTDPEGPLPWDHIDARVSKDFLKEEYNRAIAAASTSDCRNGDCHACGVCDFESILPRTAATEDIITADTITADSSSVTESSAATGAQQLQLTFTRTGRARFFSHLEQVNIFTRAINRAGIPVVFSSGFHPKPKIMFEDALPVGIESMQETAYVTIDKDVDTGRAISDLNDALPEGIDITNCIQISRKHSGGPPDSAAYRVCMDKDELDASRIDAFTSTDTFLYHRKTKKGDEKTLDLKEQVLDIEELAPGCVVMRLDNRPGSGVRPATVLRKIFELSEEQIATARIVKLPESI